MKYILRVKKKFPKCLKLPIKSQVAPVDGTLFFPATISSWNNLPFGIEKVDSVEGFKLKLKEHTFRSP